MEGLETVVDTSPVDGESVLLLCPVMADADAEACVDLLTVDDPARENLLAVTLTSSPDDRLSMWERHADTPPGNGLMVCLNPTFRDRPGAGSLGGERPSELGSMTVEYLADGADLTTLGVRLTTTLDEWAGDDRQTVVCFHSLTALLQFVPPARAEEFLRSLADRCRDADAVLHVHMDPNAHEAATVDRFKSVFDTVADLRDAEG